MRKQRKLNLLSGAIYDRIIRPEVDQVKTSLSNSDCSSGNRRTGESGLATGKQTDEQ